MDNTKGPCVKEMLAFTGTQYRPLTTHIRFPCMHAMMLYVLRSWHFLMRNTTFGIQINAAPCHNLRPLLCNSLLPAVLLS